MAAQVYKTDRLKPGTCFQFWVQCSFWTFALFQGNLNFFLKQCNPPTHIQTHTHRYHTVTAVIFSSRLLFRNNLHRCQFYIYSHVILFLEQKYECILEMAAKFVYMLFLGVIWNMLFLYYIKGSIVHRHILQNISKIP